MLGTIGIMKLVLQAIVPESADVYTFKFDRPPDITWQAGQFLEYHLEHDHADSRGKRRWFTNSAAPHESAIQITTRFSDPSSSFKQALRKLTPGDTIDAKEPEGEFTVAYPDEQYVFLAGGIGITPFRSILVDLHHRKAPLNITLIYANRTEANVPFKHELDKLADQHPEFEVVYLYEPKKLNEGQILDAARHVEEAIFYISGPEPMVESLGDSLKSSLKIPKDRIKQDFFPNYPAN